MNLRRAALCGTVVLLAACGAGLRATRATRYQGIMLNARTLGAEQLRDETSRDETVREYVDRHGPPDYVYVASPDELEIVYYGESRLVHFHRDPAAGQTAVTEREPLPTPLVNVLEPDLRAGTPGPIAPEETPPTNCWRIDAGEGTCRTCCLTSFRCSTTCG